MDDLISRAEAIELKPEFLNPNVNRETKEQTAIDRAYARGWNSCNTHWIKEIIEDLPSAQPERLTDYSFEESCTDCPAYDTENHRCPRFNQVIRRALKDANLEPCENCISRQAAIDEAEEWIETYNSGRGGQRERDAIKHVISGIKKLPSVQPERTCVNCGRTANNGGWYADGRTRCPIEEHYALPKDGYCHLWAKRNITDDDYPERREDERPES